MSTPTLTRSSPGHPTAPASDGAPATERAPSPRAAGGLQWLDLLRIGAILAVVVIHAVSRATESGGTGWHPAWWWPADLLNSFCLWCVHVFVMISGALLLDPRKRIADRAFLRRRAVRIGIPLVFWVSVYLIFQRQFYGRDLNFGSAFRSVASGDPYLQLYFLFIVAGLTLLTPVLRRLIRSCSRRELYWLTGAALLFGMLEHAVRELGGGGGFNAVTRFVPYVGYYLAGYAIATADVTDRSQRIAKRMILLGWLGTAFGSAALSARYGWTSDGYFLFDYLSPTVMALSIGVFTAARSWEPQRVAPAQLRRLGAATFGVFLIHPLLLFPLLRHFGLPDSGQLARTVVLALPIALVVCVATTGITLAVERVPGMRRLIS